MSDKEATAKKRAAIEADIRANKEPLVKTEKPIKDK